MIILPVRPKTLTPVAKTPLTVPPLRVTAITHVMIVLIFKMEEDIKIIGLQYTLFRYELDYT